MGSKDLEGFESAKAAFYNAADEATDFTRRLMTKETSPEKHKETQELASKITAVIAHLDKAQKFVSSIPGHEAKQDVVRMTHYVGLLVGMLAISANLHGYKGIGVYLQSGD